MRQETVDEKTLWLAAFLCMPRWRAAFRMASDRMKKDAGYDASEALQEAGTIPIAERSRIMIQFAHMCRELNPVLALAFEMLALRTTDDAKMIHSAVTGANGLLCSADGDTSQARACLRVWDDCARGKYDPAAYSKDFFEIADIYWSGEMQRIVASPKDPMHPALRALTKGRWDDAFGWLLAEGGEHVGAERAQALLDAVRERGYVQTEIRETIEHLYAVGTPSAGGWALAWSMLTIDPAKPDTFSPVLPQLQYALDSAELDENADAELRARIRIWWRGAEGEWTDSLTSIFRISDVETRDASYDREDEDLPLEPRTTTTSGELAQALGLPTLVVMPSARATKLNNFHAAYKDVVDAALPLVVVHDVSSIRAALHREFPHATAAVDLVLRDLRDGKPLRLKPVCLVGAPGCGKSRLVRRLADMLRAFVYRFDGAASTDGHFGGTSKAWGNTEASVPMRAIAQSRIANPVVLVDEIDKASDGRNGRLFDSLLPFCDLETAARYRDQSLDAEVDLSAVSVVATANDVSKLPAALRDRLRIVRVSSPTLQHLPQLAAQVIKDLAIEDEARHGDALLAVDELAVIGRAWAKAGFSMRALQKIVSATLEARDSYAMRH